MSAQPATAAAPERVAGVFFRWEIAEEGAAVDIHLNVVELLERDAMRARNRMAGGLLLGRVTRGKVLTLVIEHYEPVTPERGALVSPFADTDRMETMVNRWRSGQSRLSLVGLYRTCTSQNVFLTNDDLGALGTYFKDRVAEVIPTSLEGSKLSPQATPSPAADSTDAERVFLLIEPGVAGANSKAVLHLTRGGTVAWQSPSTLFNRNELARRRAANQEQAPETKPAPKATHQESAEPASEEGTYRPKSGFNRARAMKWGVVSVGVAMLLVTTFFQLRGRVDLSSPFASAPAPAPADPHLGLKLDQTGNSWKLSWNAESPALTDATHGRLVVTDGGMHKEIELDGSDLRGGTIIYSPITQDVVLRLEVDSPASPEPISESVRTVGGLLVSPTEPTDATNTLPPSVNDSGAQQESAAAGEPPLPADLQNPEQPAPANSASPRTAEEVLGKLGIPQTPKASAPMPPADLPVMRQQPQPALSGTQPVVPAVTKPAPAHALVPSRQPSPVVTRAALMPTPKAPAPTRTAELQPKKIVPASANKAEPASTQPKVASQLAVSAPPVQPRSLPKPRPVVAEQQPAVSEETIHQAIKEVAQLISKRDPDYPLSAKQAHVSGSVAVTFTIDADGQVRNVRVTRGPEELASAAVEAVQEWRYKPARLDGVPVATQGNAVLVFRMN